MTMRSQGHKHLRTLWRSKKVCWHWWVLAYGVAQPKRFCWLDRYRFRYHLTPFHLERWGSTWEIGLCLGFRTIYVERHK